MPMKINDDSCEIGVQSGLESVCAVSDRTVSLLWYPMPRRHGLVCQMEIPFDRMLEEMQVVAYLVLQPSQEWAHSLSFIQQDSVSLNPEFVFSSESDI